ncbi:hypothetical protein [Streptomyces sp. NPDC057686]
MTALLDEHPHLGVEPVLRELSIPSTSAYRPALRSAATAGQAASEQWE